MFTQLRVLYPKSSLISDLVTIDRGKYVVRAIVQVEGVMLATAMAAAETLELAEDRARSRVLTVLGIQPTTANGLGTMESPSLSGEVSIPSMTLTSTPQPISSQPVQTNQSPMFSEFGVNKDALDLSFSERYPDSTDVPPIPWETSSLPDGDDFSRFEVEKGEDSVFDLETPTVPTKPAVNDLMPEEQEVSEETSEPIKPVTPTSKVVSSKTQTNVRDISPTSIPEDLSDVINQTNVEMKRLGWNQVQGKDYLKRTYGKVARSQLTGPELLEFLHYLESQPNPED